MKNRLFKDIGYWSGLTSVILVLINFIVCFIEGTKIYGLMIESWGDLFIYPSTIASETLIYKISILIIVISILMMTISYIVNADGILKTTMIVCKSIQLICIIGGGIAYYVRAAGILKVLLIGFSIVELIVLILYIIDQDHRKTILQVILFSIITVFSPLVYMLVITVVMFYLFIKIFLFVGSIFFYQPEHKTAILDLDGNIIGWLKKD